MQIMQLPFKFFIRNSFLFQVKCNTHSLCPKTHQKVAKANFWIWWSGICKWKLIARIKRFG